MPQAIGFSLEFLDQIERITGLRHHSSRADGRVVGVLIYTGTLREDREIGNIVNPLGTCIDVGFGLERLDMIVHGRHPAAQHGYW